MPDAPSTGIAIAGLALGLVSGVHCVGMCGGIVAAFSAQPGIVRVVRKADETPGAPSLGLLALFNAGRIGAYTLAGAIAGSIGSAGAYVAGAIDLQTLLFLGANLMLVLIGLYLAGLSPMLARVEKLGVPLWRRIQPLAARFLPADTPARAFIAGSLWGWLPCGLVYGMLATAVASGSTAGGALAMLAFGLGTLPNLMLAGMALSRMHKFAARPRVRQLAGGLVLSFGLLGLARAADLGEAIRRGLLCL